MPTHPSDADLRAYGLGRLDDARAAGVAKHLDACPDCRRRAAEASSDSFLGRLRDARGESGLAEGPRPAAASMTGGPPVAAPPADSLPSGLADHPDYKILRELGRGGMGVVYLAHNIIMGRDEVLKVMGAHIMARPGIFERFQREIRAVARLRHPNIVTAYSAFRLDGGLVFAMEYVEGMDLARLIKVKGPLPVRHAAFFAQQTAQGLQHAHERGMVHRDIKPHNLMLTHDGDLRVVKILDFGLAKATREGNVDGALTQADQALGTPDYIAPEQIVNAPEVDVRADVYSLGCTLYFFLTGRPPFRANSLYDLYQAHISRDADPLNRLRPDVPSGLSALVGKMMAKDPADRFQTPAEVAQALAPFLKKGAADDRPPRAAPRPAAADPVVDLTLDDRPLSIPLAPAPGRPAPGQPAAPEAEWTSLIDFRPTEPAGRSATPPPAPLPALAAARGKLPPRAVAIGFGALGASLVLALLAWQILVKTPYGTIVLDDLPRDADVTIDGAKADVSWTEGGAGQISVAAGPHGLEVRQGRVKLHGSRVTVDAGKPFSIRLEPLAAADRGRENAGAKDVVPAPVDSEPSSIGASFWPEAEGTLGMRFARYERPISLSPDHRLLACRLDRNALRIFAEPSSGRPPVTLAGHKDFLWQAAFTPDGSRVVTCGNDGYVRIWDARAGAELLALRHGAGVMNVVYSRDGRRIASAGMDSVIRIWDAVTGAEEAILKGHSDYVHHVEFSPDGRFLIGSCSDWAAKRHDLDMNQLLLWDLETSSFKALRGHAMGVKAATFSPDGRLLASVGLDKTVKLWDAATNDCLGTIELKDEHATEVAFSPDGSLLAASSLDDVVRLWDVSDRTLVASLTGASGRYLDFLEFSRDGRRIYACGDSLKSWRIPPLENAPPPAADGFTSLFNGRDLTGWKPHRDQHGGWTVVDGALVGTAPGVSHLYSERGDYKDFHLRLRARINDGGNSGVFIRASNAPVMPPGSPRWPSGYEVQINSTHADPNRTGSLYSLGKAVNGRPAAPPKPDDWFDMEVVARGNHIVVIVDGETRLDFVDAQRAAASGHLALQVHDAKTRVEFQKIEIKELKGDAPAVAADGFTPLFNRWDLGGWETRLCRPGDWRVEGGALVGAAPRLSYLHTTRGDYKDFELHVEAKAAKGSNGLLLFRATADPGPKWPTGYEVQLDGTGPTKAGTLRRTAGGLGSNPAKVVGVSEDPATPGEWFKLDVRVEGSHIVVKVNDRVTADYVDPSPIANAGHIALQVHDAKTRVEFRRIEIKELKGDAPRAAPADGFTPLFNGKDISNWKTHPSQPGGWRVEGGAIVGTAPGISHLYSARGDYKDFELRVKARIAEGGNSGVLFRSSDVPRPQWPVGYEAQIYTGKGSQTGSLYRGAGGPETTITRPVAAPSGLTKADDWFTMNVRVEGSHIVIKVNDQTAADYVDPDPLARSGHIALQVNGAQTRVEFWDVEIKELNAPPRPAPAAVPPRAGVPVGDGFTPLFNGKDISNWKTHPSQPGGWRVEGGAIVGTATGLSHLYTTRGDYKDFELHVEARINDGGNSGIFVRATDGPRPQSPAGYEAQVVSTGQEVKKTGSLYRTPGGPPTSNSAPVVVLEQLAAPDEWFKIDMVVEGSHIIVKVNDRTTADYVDPTPIASAGHIALQVHDPQTRVHFRRIEIKELNAPPRPAAGPREGFSRIFNEKDLSGWKVDSGPRDGWTVEGGSLTAKGPGDWKKAGFILGDKDYGDFRLRFEYQASVGANSGVTFRARPGEFERAVPHPLQVELFDADHDVLKNGTFFWSTSFDPKDALPPYRPASTGPALGWNAAELAVLDDVMTFSINGREVLEARLDTLARRAGANPALGRRRGRIGFQCATGTVRFRKIEIQEDPPAAAWPVDAREFRGARYKLFPEKLSWHRAEAECRRLGGRLAVVRDGAQDAFLHGLVREAKAEAAWLGATDERQERRWAWVDGSPMTYANWAATQPNNKGAGEHYLVLVDVTKQGEPFEGRWSDQPDVSAQHTPAFICEWPAAGAK